MAQRCLEELLKQVFASSSCLQQAWVAPWLVPPRLKPLYHWRQFPAKGEKALFQRVISSNVAELHSLA